MNKYFSFNGKSGKYTSSKNHQYLNYSCAIETGDKWPKFFNGSYRRPIRHASSEFNFGVTLTPFSSAPLVQALGLNRLNRTPCLTAQYIDCNTPEKFQNTALFLRLGLLFTLFRTANGSRRKHYSNRRNLKTPGGGGSVNVLIITWLRVHSSLSAVSDCSNFSGSMHVNGKHLMPCFRRENSVFKFL